MKLPEPIRRWLLPLRTDWRLARRWATRPSKALPWAYRYLRWLCKCAWEGRWVAPGLCLRMAWPEPPPTRDEIDSWNRELTRQEEEILAQLEAFQRQLEGDDWDDIRDTVLEADAGRTGHENPA